MWIVGVILLLASGGLAYGYVQQRDKLGAMQATETATARELSTVSDSVAQELGAGAFRQVTEVKGDVVCDNPLTSELAEVPCVYYSMTVTREYEETYWDTDPNGERQRRTRKGSDVVASNSRSVKFDVRDDTGRITVNPEGAKFIADKVLSEFESGEAEGNALQIGGFRLSVDLPGLGSGRHTLGYRYEEEAIELGSSVYVLGEASDKSGSLEVVTPDEAGEFLISVKSEEELTKSAQSSMKWMQIGAIGAGILGVILLIAGLF